MQLLRQLDEQASELDDVRELIAAITHAAPFFRARSDEDQWLYRGIDEDMYPPDGFVAVHRPRTDRQPLSSSPLLHKALDRKFLERYNIPYRSEGLFVIGDRATARSYGKPVIVLPEGNFRFCWSRRVNDAFAHFDLTNAFRYIHQEAAKIGEDLEKYPALESLRELTTFIQEYEWARKLFDQWMDWSFEEAEYSDQDLPAAIDSSHEIMIKCEKFAVIASPETVRDYYINAAEHILGVDLGFDKAPNMKDFINTIARKVVH